MSLGNISSPNNNSNPLIYISDTSVSTTLAISTTDTVSTEKNTSLNGLANRLKKRVSSTFNFTTGDQNTPVRSSPIALNINKEAIENKLQPEYSTHSNLAKSKRRLSFSLTDLKTESKNENELKIIETPREPKLTRRLSSTFDVKSSNDITAADIQNINSGLAQLTVLDNDVMILRSTPQLDVEMDKYQNLDDLISFLKKKRSDLIWKYNNDITELMNLEIKKAENFQTLNQQDQIVNNVVPMFMEGLRASLKLISESNNPYQPNKEIKSRIDQLRMENNEFEATQRVKLRDL